MNLEVCLSPHFRLIILFGAFCRPKTVCIPLGNGRCFQNIACGPTEVAPSHVRSVYIHVTKGGTKEDWREMVMRHRWWYDTTTALDR